MIAKVNIYAEAYYSGASYDETLFANYEAVKHLNGTEMSVGELDGKHSDVWGEITVEMVSDDYFKNNVAPENDGDCLHWHLKESCDIDERDILDPVFGKIRRTITCTPEQWERIERLLCL